MSRDKSNNVRQYERFVRLVYGLILQLYSSLRRSPSTECCAQHTGVYRIDGSNYLILPYLGDMILRSRSLALRVRLTRRSRPHWSSTGPHVAPGNVISISYRPG